MAVREFMQKSAFGKVLNLTMSGNDRVYNRSCGRVFFSLTLWQSPFKVKLQAFTNGSVGVFCQSLL